MGPSVVRSVSAETNLFVVSSSLCSSLFFTDKLSVALRGIKEVLFVVLRVGATVVEVVKIRIGRFLLEPKSLLLALSVVVVAGVVVVVAVVVVDVEVDVVLGVVVVVVRVVVVVGM